ncbi:hypothetical protein [Sorangium sp. So ce1097]
MTPAAAAISQTSPRRNDPGDGAPDEDVAGEELADEDGAGEDADETCMG